MDEVVHDQPPYSYIFKDLDYQAFVNWKLLHPENLVHVYLLEYRGLLLFSQGYQYIRAKSIEDAAAAATVEADHASRVTKVLCGFSWIES
jgi:hypothetical protein